MTSRQEDTASGPFDSKGDVRVGFSDTVILGVSIIGFLTLASVIYSILIIRLKKYDELDDADEAAGGGEGSTADDYDRKLAQADVTTLNRAQRRARAKFIMKQRRRVAPVENAAGGEEQNVDADGQQLQLLDDGEDDGDQDTLITESTKAMHLSRKERQKAAKAAEKEERKLFEEARREQQQLAQEQAQREKRERERVEAERTAEEKRVRLQKKKEAEEAEYKAWKTFIRSPDGSVELSVKQWLQEMRANKTIVLVELADRMGVTEDQVVRRIQVLLDSGRVSGLFDGNGRFIYLTKDEMISIANAIQDAGEMALGDIAEIVSTIAGLEVKD